MNWNFLIAIYIYYTQTDKTSNIYKVIQVHTYFVNVLLKNGGGSNTSPCAMEVERGGG